MKYENIAIEFIKDKYQSHNSPFDRFEIDGIISFAEWLDKQEKILSNIDLISRFKELKADLDRIKRERMLKNPV